MLLRRGARPRGVGLRLPTQLLHQRQDGGVRRGSRLLLEKRFVRSSMLDGFGRLARGHERGHEAERALGAERIERREPAPPVGCRPVVAARGGLLRQGCERVAALLFELRALRRHPALELARFAEIEAVQERSAVAVDSTSQLATLERVVKGLDVARDGGRVQPQFGRAEEQLVLVEVPAEGVAGLSQQAPAVRCVGFRPEVGDDLVATQAAGVSGEQGKEGERLALGRRARGGSAVGLDGQPAERPQLDHADPV